MPSALLEEVPRVWLLAGFGLSLALNLLLLLLLLLAGRRRRPAAPAPAGLAEQRLAAEHAVAAALAATSSWEEAAPGVLRALCDNLGWDRAEFWEVGPSGERITLRASWPAPGAAEPRAVPGKGVCAPGEGLPGRVWASGRPLWVEDVRRDSTLPPDATVRAAFGFPVRLDEEILGVVICYDRSIRQSREDLLGMAGAVGSQLGQYIRRTRAEQELRAGERFAAAVIDGAPLGIGVFAPDGALLRANPALRELLGGTAGDHAGGPAALFGGSEEIARAFEEALAGRPGRVLGASVTAPGAADGRAVDCLFYPVPEDGVRAVVAFAWDRTEQRELEQRLRQAGKLEAIGLLAGGVAHDFNNLLAAIRGNLELVELPEDHPGQQRLAEAEHAVQQAAHLAGQLLRFARRKDIQLSPVDVGEVIAGAAPLLRRAVGPRVALEVRGGTGGWRVLGDAAQIEQVLMNLAVNARDAMPQGGRLLIETAPVTLTGEEAERLGGPPEPVGLPAGSAVPGEFVRVRVTDTGCGMDEQTRARLFEPFFTTKEPGQGTGLGLAVVHGTMRQHGGWVRCESAPGAGTTFELYFPRTEAPAPEPAAEPADTGPPRPGRGGGETVLVVEDEPSLRGIAREMLQQGGYRVLLAADGAEALEVYRSRPGEIDLVLLDWVMPRLGGEETYRRLRQIDPRARVLFCTGYGVDEASIPAGAAGWIAKPYRKAGLLAAVAAALAGRPVEGDTLPRGLE